MENLKNMTKFETELQAKIPVIEKELGISGLTIDETKQMLKYDSKHLLDILTGAGKYKEDYSSLLKYINCINATSNMEVADKNNATSFFN